MEDCGAGRDGNGNSAVDVDMSVGGGNGTEKDSSSKVRHLVRLFNSMSQISLSVDNDSEITQTVAPNNEEGLKINSVNAPDNDHAIRDSSKILSETISGVSSYVTMDAENQIPSTHVQTITSSISENHEHETQQSENANTNSKVR